MSKSLKDAESLHTDQHDSNIISSVVNSSDEAGQKNDKAGNNSYDEPAKRISGNVETSSTSKRDKRQSQEKGKKIPHHQNAPTKGRKKSSSRREKKEKFAFLILIFYIQFIIQLVY